MLDFKDPAIKLFGKTISLPFNPHLSPTSPPPPPLSSTTSFPDDTSQGLQPPSQDQVWIQPRLWPHSLFFSNSKHLSFFKGPKLLVGRSYFLQILWFSVSFSSGTWGLDTFFWVYLALLWFPSIIRPWVCRSSFSLSRHWNHCFLKTKQSSISFTGPFN